MNIEKISKQKAYITQITHRDTQDIPYAKIGMCIGDAVMFNNDTNRYLIHLRHLPSDFGWRLCTNFVRDKLPEFDDDELFWWVAAADLKLKKYSQLEVE